MHSQQNIKISKKRFCFIKNRFLEPNMHFTLKINSDISSSFIGSNQPQILSYIKLTLDSMQTYTNPL